MHAAGRPGPRDEIPDGEALAATPAPAFALRGGDAHQRTVGVGAPARKEPEIHQPGLVLLAPHAGTTTITTG